MTPQERDLILGLFQRLKPPPEGDIDGEARELIDGLVGQQKLAPYLLVQTALVQESALKGAQARIANLEAKLAQASTAAAPEAPRRSFLSGLLGDAPARPASPYAPQGAAPIAAAAPGPWGSRGAPSFLQSALSTAAGVAGGALLFQGIEHMLGYGGSPFAGVAGAGAAQPVEDITVNNFEQAPQDVSAPDPGNDPSLDTTPVDDPGFDQGGFGDASGFQDV